MVLFTWRRSTSERSSLFAHWLFEFMFTRFRALVTFFRSGLCTSTTSITGLTFEQVISIVSERGWVSWRVFMYIFRTLRSSTRFIYRRGSCCFWLPWELLFFEFGSTEKLVMVTLAHSSWIMSVYWEDKTCSCHHVSGFCWDLDPMAIVISPEHTR